MLLITYLFIREVSGTFYIEGAESWVSSLPIAVTCHGPPTACTEKFSLPLTLLKAEAHSCRLSGCHCSDLPPGKRGCGWSGSGRAWGVDLALISRVCGL